MLTRAGNQSGAHHLTAGTQNGVIALTNSDGSPERSAFLLGLLGQRAQLKRSSTQGRKSSSSGSLTEGILSAQWRRRSERWYAEGRHTRRVFLREFDTVRETSALSRHEQEANELHAVLIQEGRAASGGRSELFTNGSVEWPAEGILVRPAHLAATEVRAVPQRGAQGRITIAANLTPALRAAWDAGKRFMSVEFHALQERTVKSGTREIQRAMVFAGALVERPEYDTATAELREETANAARQEELLRWL